LELIPVSRPAGYNTHKPASRLPLLSTSPSHRDHRPLPFSALEALRNALYKFKTYLLTLLTLANTKLNCLLSETPVYEHPESLCSLTVEWLGAEPVICHLQGRYSEHCVAKPHKKHKTTQSSHFRHKIIIRNDSVNVKNDGYYISAEKTGFTLKN